MKYKCDDCGEIFDSDNAEETSECVGEFWGAPAYMKFMICPYCRSRDIYEYHESEESDDE